MARWFVINVIWYGLSLKNLKIELLYDSAIPFLDKYSEKSEKSFQKDTCIQMFIAVLFIIAKTWKQPRCPSTDDWIKIWYMYTMNCYSAIKSNEIMPFAPT